MEFESEDNRIEIALANGKHNIVYYGFRPKDSYKLHDYLSRKHKYPYKPPGAFYSLIDTGKKNRTNKTDIERPVGMIKDNSNYRFDSAFESGNLDMAIKVKENEYDLYMRVDSNTKGHHQWFYFSVQSESMNTVKFNVVNFTKSESLYKQGMRIAVFSEKKAEKAILGELPELYSQWHRGGNNITYKTSKLSHELYQRAKIM